MSDVDLLKIVVRFQAVDYVLNIKNVINVMLVESHLKVNFTIEACLIVEQSDRSF